jgi:tRNA(His) 5'-end guanylyltransferase
LAQAHFSYKQLHGLNTKQMQELLWKEKGVNWSEQPPTFKNGSMLYRQVIFTTEGSARTFWLCDAAPIFTQERAILSALIPSYEDAE